MILILTVCSFVLAIGVGYVGWVCRLNHMPQRFFTGCACVFVVVFLTLTIIDAQAVKEKTEKANAQYELDAQIYNPSEDLPAYLKEIMQREQAILNSFEWSEVTASLQDSKNLTTAAAIFKGVLLSKTYYELPELTADNDAYAELINEPLAYRCNSYELTGICTKAQVCNDEQLVDLFIPEGSRYQLLEITCSIDSSDCLILRSCDPDNIQAQLPNIGNTYRCSATFIGTATEQGEAFLVFIAS